MYIVGQLLLFLELIPSIWFYILFTTFYFQLGEVHGSDGASDEREKDIRNHFTSRCSHLYMQLTSAASQAALYQNEVCVLDNFIYDVYLQCVIVCHK